MKKNKLKNKAKSNVENMLFTLPKSCSCNTCVDAKNYIKNEIGESRFLMISQEIGLIV